MINAPSYLSPFLAFLTGGLAYLDPGSGSFILQLLVATLLGGAFLLKAYWQKIISFFRKSPADEQTEPDENTKE